LTRDINNLIVVSDLHCGCQVGLCPPKVRLDGGGYYKQNAVQVALWHWWNEFWNEWVPYVTKGEPFAVVINGDTTDGHHHNSKTQITSNFSDQENIAYNVLSPIVEKAGGQFWIVRGTEAHVGQSAENEERLARRLGAVPNEWGRHSHFEVWARVGHGLVHLAHHIGTTGRAAYETSALMAELMEMFVESSKWRDEPPDVVVRSHRHRHIEVRVPTANTYGICFTTPGWQGKTPFVFKIPGGRVTRPQFGGALIRCNGKEVFTRQFTRSLERAAVFDLATGRAEDETTAENDANG